MQSGLAHVWWALAVRGVLAIIFGIIAFFWPGLFWLAVVFTFGIYAILDGIMALVLAFTGEGQVQHWWALLLEGIAGLVAGVLAFIWPGITMLVLLYLIAAWAFVHGVFEIIAAIRLRRQIPNEWLLILIGLMSIALGIALALVPAVGLVVVAWWVGAYAVIAGIMMLILSFRLRALLVHPTAMPGSPSGAR
jgi:uncharacterized membrane protein HdeD (DUF308 family)